MSKEAWTIILDETGAVVVEVGQHLQREDITLEELDDLASTLSNSCSVVRIAMMRLELIPN